MNAAIPGALIENYEELIEGLKLPDADDRHVLAAAIKAGAETIVTSNLKDFPAGVLATYGIEARVPTTSCSTNSTSTRASCAIVFTRSRTAEPGPRRPSQPSSTPSNAPDWSSRPQHCATENPRFGSKAVISETTITRTGREHTNGRSAWRCDRHGWGQLAGGAMERNSASSSRSGLTCLL